MRTPGVMGLLVTAFVTNDLVSGNCIKLELLLSAVLINLIRYSLFCRSASNSRGVRSELGGPDSQLDQLCQHLFRLDKHLSLAVTDFCSRKGVDDCPFWVTLSELLQILFVLAILEQVYSRRHE